jgi:hypothetical protein
MKLRQGEAVRGKWRILDGKGSEWYVFMFKALKVVAPVRVNYGLRWLGLEEQASIMYRRMQDLWGPIDFVAWMVTESDDTLLHLQDVNQNSVWAIHGCPNRHRMSDVH